MKGLVLLSNRIFTNKNYCIYKSDSNSRYKYIVHNINKPFEDAHTHVESFQLGKIMIYTCIKGELPSKSKRLYNNYRFIESITRVVSNKYKNKFENILYDLGKNIKRDIT